MWGLKPWLEKIPKNQIQKIWTCNNFHVGLLPPNMVLPEELGSWWTQLQDATDEALTLI